MGYLMLFEHIGLDYTWSTYASEGGNFGFFTSHEMMKRLNAKMYAESKRLGVKWILGGECGHMWRVVHQYMDTLNGPADWLEMPVSPLTGTRFENAASTKMVHITEFTADLIKNNKLKLDPSQNDHIIPTFHDSCNTSRGMGMLEEPRYVLNNVCNNFVDMAPQVTRENTFCCGSGSGLNAGEYLEMRFRGGLPRANAVKRVHEDHGVNMLSCVCAIDRAVFPALMDYWVPGVGVCGLSELVANALVMEGQGEREYNLRGEENPSYKPPRRKKPPPKPERRVRSNVRQRQNHYRPGHLRGHLHLPLVEQPGRGGPGPQTAASAQERGHPMRGGHQLHAHQPHGHAQRLARRRGAQG